MRLRALGILAFLMASCLGSMALPDWWDTADISRTNSGTFTRPESSDPPEGALEIYMPNLYQLHATKYLYFVLNWSSTNPNANIDPPIQFKFATNSAWSDGYKVVNTVDGNNHHWEYSFVITPQPAQEWAKISYSIDLPGYTIDYSYDFRAICIPEPSTLTILALGGLTALRWLRPKKC